MEVEQIRTAVLDAIRWIAPETDPAGIRPDRPLRGQIDLDSMDWLNLLAGLHDRLGVEIPESDYGRLETLDAIVAYVASGRACPAGGGGERRGQAAPPPGELPRVRRPVGGAVVTVRPIRREDAALEAEFVRGLSAESRYQRFIETLNELPPGELNYLTDVDQVRHVALVATVERQGREAIAGVARYIADASGAGCEFSIVVGDDWQGSGLAGVLMHELTRVARARGLRTMEGLVLATNTRMLKFVRRLGFAHRRDPGDRETVRVVREL